MTSINEIPNEFICPITLEIMTDPVICDDGHSYERTAISRLTTSISPITRQYIDLTRLIPNRALKNTIDKFNSGQRYDPQINSFEREQKKKCQEIRKQMIKEKRKKKEELRLQHVADMFNSYHNIYFSCGGTKTKTYDGNNFTLSWDGIENKKYIFTLGILQSIKNEQLPILSIRYKKMIVDFIWIKKNIYESQETKPYVDFVYDNYKSVISIYEDKILKYANDEEMIDYLPIYDKLIKQLKTLDNKPKEYYYEHYEEFKIIIPPHDFKNPKYETGLNDLYLLWYIEKHNKFNSLFQNITSIYHEPQNNVGFCYKIVYGDCDYLTEERQVNIIQSYTQYFGYLTRTKQTSINQWCPYIQDETDIECDYEPADFQPLMKLTKAYIELIEYLRPDVINY